MNELAKTIETYNHIAPDYAKAWAKRGHQLDQITQFAALVKPGGLVADVGCGAGLDTAVFPAYNLRAIGLDFSFAMMQAGRAHYETKHNFAQADMRRLPLPNGRLDGIWACASMLHLARGEFTAVLQQFYRILAPGGVLYLSLKEGDGEDWQRGAYGHAERNRFYTYWQPQAVDEALKTAGFQKIDGWVDDSEKVNWIVRFAHKQRVARGQSIS